MTRSTLGRYLAGNLLQGWLLVLTVTAVLFGLIELIGELDRVSPTYSSLQVIAYVLMTLPQMLVSLAPVIIFLGSLIALSRMEQLSELTVMRGTGLSKRRLLGLLLQPALLMAAVLLLLMEFVSAPLHQQGEELRHKARGSGELNLRSDLWSRDGRNYFRLGGLTGDRQPADIEIFEFDPDNRLLRSIHARRATIIAERRWELQEVRVREWQSTQARAQEIPSLVVDNLWSQPELPLLLLGNDSMPLRLLHEYARYLERTGQTPEPYAVAFWSRLMLPASCVGMVLLATAMGTAPGGARSGMGRQLGLGTLIAVLFYLGSQILVAFGQILSLPPILTGLLPLLALALVTALLLWRLRW